MKHKVKIGKQSTRADFAPNTFNSEARTIDVVFATDTPVLRYSWDGPFYEVLDMSGHMTDRSAGSLPVLNNHDRYTGVTGIIGRAENVRLENGKWMATVRFSQRDDVKPIIQDVQDGIIQDISVGYRVHSYEKTPDAAEIPTYVARKWESNEISFVTVPADQNAKVRHQEGETNEVEIIETNPKRQTENQNTMKREQIIALLEKRGVSFDKNATDDELVRLLEETFTKPADDSAARSAAVAAERQRVKDITDAVRAAKLDEAFAARHIQEGTAIDAVRTAVIEELAKKDQNNNSTRSANPTIGVGTEQVDKVRSAMEEAITHRVNPSSKLDAGREFRGMSLMDMARFSLEQAGIKTNGWSRREIATAALNINSERNYHSSSDFPIILGNTVNRTLRAAYEFQTRTFQPFTRRVNLSDFKEITRAQLSGLIGSFDNIPEGGEYKSATLNEGKEAYKLAKYGKKIAISWEALINDDLSAFSRIPQAIAAKAAQKQSDIVYDILLNNPTMGDSVALFHSTHGNLAGAGTTIPNGIAAARTAMRKQTDPNGDYINVAPSFLIVGPDKETEAQQLINATIVATKTADTNVFRGSVDIIVEPRITGNQWFMAAAPSSIDTIEVAFLDGEQELFTEQRTGFDVDGLEIKARMVFAAKAIDWRGFYKNPGA